MHPTTTKLLLFLLVVVTAAAFGNRATACLPRERDALLAFKRGITEDLAGRLASWRRGGDCCRWRGVRCSNRTGHVLEIRLRNSEAHFYDRDIYGGELVAYIGPNALSGQINPSLFSLEHLEHLDLGWNSLDLPSGAHSSKLLGSLNSLRYLNLSGLESYDASLLPWIGNLSKLQHLDLFDSYPSVQPTDLSWLTRLPLLRHLRLARVDLSMVHDWPRVVNTIPSLGTLDLSNCSLQNANQPLPHLNLTELESLDLSYNFFDHPSRPCWFWNLTSLKYLNLGSSHLYGQFPNTLGEMTSLRIFDFSNNRVSHGINRVPTVLGPNLMRNLCNLEVLNLQEGLSYGNITELYEGLSHCSPSLLRELNLGRNNITGTLPTGIAHFTNLVNLHLSGNHLTGHVPSEIGMLNNLVSLNLGDNNLTGLITEAHFSSLTSLMILDFSQNQIIGSLPKDLEKIMSLDVLLLHGNQITG
ncbi:hypothetical protein ACQ4PT_010222 [Festuca glaucescens]